MTEELPITSSEWEVMRIIWTMGQATSNEVVHLL
ncbi:BlaI/MecI/CopY family transcriptional regulator, partial [Pediococcus ethanolidurans]